MKVKLLLALALAGSFACSRQTQINGPEPIKPVDSEPLNVIIDSSGTFAMFGPCEPSIAISPVNTQLMAAGAVLDRVYYSQDGGRSWAKSQLKSPFGVYGDPVILADHAGNFFYAHLSDPAGRGWSDPRLLDRIVIQKSTDGGKSWNDGSFTGFRHPKDQDKHWLAVDPRNNHLYVSWTEFDKYDSRNAADKSRILFSKSTDGGENWSDPIAINQYDGDCLDDDNTVEGAVPAVGPNGEVYVAWSFAGNIYFDRSLDGGKTWLDEDIIVADQPGGWTFDIPGINRCNGLPVTTVDLSNGPNRGTIYVNWSDQRNGPNDTDVWVAKSTDGGKTWSAPLRINDDKPGKQQFLTWMSVDQTNGHLYVVFYDRRNYSDNQTDVFLARSTDGGRTFTNNRISSNPFTPNEAVFFGDYNHISAHNGVVRPIWTRNDGTRLSVWTALINL